mmetsp:Transcript_131603/g.232582  ORF Transcript_131603/g.232582 Transcript_131603/m.232582 type:complete len:875 (+) Transcript_131603:82-2706(+)
MPFMAKANHERSAAKQRWSPIASGGLILLVSLAARDLWTSTADPEVLSSDDVSIDDSLFLQTTLLKAGVSPPSQPVFAPVDLLDGRLRIADLDPNATEHDDAQPQIPGMSQVLGTDLLGDALDPTDHGSGSKPHTPGHGAAEGIGPHHHGYMALLFLFGGLSLGSLVLMLNERYIHSVPYTCMLFVAGFLISTVHHLKREKSLLTWPSWFISVDMWEEMDPHLLFYIFLPALVFSEAMRMNVHHVKMCIWQILLLAGPGVLLGTVLMGAFSHFILPYGWDWPICLVLGAILSATDPVAVVALFNTLGVSPRLTMIISGESLFNDGTAVVCFTLMLKVLLGASLSPVHVVLFFANMIVLSALLGFIVASVALWVISCCALERGHSDAMVQVMVTICCGYTCFFIAENELSTSGILSLVSAGLALAGSIWPRFVSKEVVHTVWEAVEFIGNTVVFLLAGLLFADSCLSRREHIQMMDMVWLFVMYIAVMVIRALTVMILWVPLRHVGAALDWKEGLVMVWAGLRGAVSLALAIIVDIEPMVSKKMGTRVMFHVGGIAGLTLLINSTTTAHLLKWLGLTNEPEERERMLQHIERHISEQAVAVMLEDLKKGADLRFKDADAELVYSMIPNLRPQQEESPKVHAALSARSLDQEEKLRIAAKEKNYREVFLQVVQSHYWGAIEDGIIPRNDKVARVLLRSKDEAMIDSDKRLSDWKPIFDAVDVLPASNSVGALLSQLAESPAFSWFPGMAQVFPSMEVVHAWKAYAALSFLEAHRHARDEVPKYFDASDALDRQVQEHIAEESEQECGEAEHLLSQIPVQAVRYGKSRMLARKLLRLQLHEVEQLAEHGVLSTPEAHHFEDNLRDSLQQVQPEAAKR